MAAELVERVVAATQSLVLLEVLGTEKTSRDEAQDELDAARVKLTDRIESLEREIASLRAENERLAEKAMVGEYMWSPAELGEALAREREAAALVADNYLPSTFDTKAIAAAIRNMGGEG